MLHAFNQKNVRRILTRPRDDHAIGKDEDGITSMVFSPLVFMTPASAVAVLEEIIGKPLALATAGRHPTACDLQFWPRGLQEVGRDGLGSTRCEPDFLALIQFDAGAPVLVIGEMKWDWAVPADQLREQIDRQRSAMARTHPNATIVTLTVTKQRVSSAAATGIAQRTWIDVHRAALDFVRHAPTSPEGRWGALVAEFLSRAAQMSFQGFVGARAIEAPPQPIFWRVAA